MPHKSFTFNGVRKPWLYIERGRSKPPFAARRRNLLTVPGYPGGYLQSTDVEPLIINQPIGFRVTDDAYALTKADELAEWLLTDEPAPLELDDEPGRIYYAVLQNTLDDFEKIAVLRSGTITFLCVDPYKYGPEKTATFPADAVTLTNEGTAEAEPIFTLEVLAPITFAMIQNQDNEYMMIGQPIDVETSETYQEYELILNENMSSLTGWTTAAIGEIDGEVAGSIESNGARFQPGSFGSGSGWHGPAVKTSLSEVLMDFRLETTIGFWNATPNIVGRAEVYLLDEQGEVVGKVIMKDTQNGDSIAWGEIRIGDSSVNYHLINEYGDTKGVWNDFFGVLRVERKGNEWYAYIAMVDQNTGKHHSRRSVYWTDANNQFTRNVAQVVVHFGQYASFNTGAMGNYDVKVYKINQEPEGIPYIANSGDLITFDHTKNGEVLINGEPYENIQFGSDFFKLKKGVNQLIAQPSDSFDVACRYRDRFK